MLGVRGFERGFGGRGGCVDVMVFSTVRGFGGLGCVGVCERSCYFVQQHLLYINSSLGICSHLR